MGSSSGNGGIPWNKNYPRCDVERSFSSLKWVRDERQLSMQEDCAAVLLRYNGLVGDWD